MSRNAKIAIGLGVVVVVGAIIVIALVLANLGAIAAMDRV